MAFEEKHPRGYKLLVKNKIIEQVSHFNYLACDISSNYDADLQTKLNKFQYMCGTNKHTLTNKTTIDTQLKFCKVKAIPMLFMEVKLGH
jgi:hypothetical protein